MSLTTDSLTTPSPELAHRIDFTFARYRELLGLAAKTWTFRGYTDFDRDERFVIWRHDIDLSVPCALRQAQIEQEEGVRATYFVNPHSEYYNLAESETHRMVRAIIECGHDIGLHFDSAFFGIANESELDSKVALDASLIEQLYGIEVKTFSFHNTTPFVLGCRNWTYGGRFNTYAEYFPKEVGYCSDSNGYWRHRRLEDVLREANDQRLQVLTHDGWWNDEVMSPRECVQQSLSRNAKQVFATYQQHMRTFGMRDVGELEGAWESLREVDPVLAKRAEWLFLDGYAELALIELWRSLPSNARAVLAGTISGAAAARVVDLVLRGEEIRNGTLHSAITSCIRSHVSGAAMLVSVA
jgi:hypothetical protein